MAQGLGMLPQRHVDRNIELRGKGLASGIWKNKWTNQCLVARDNKEVIIMYGHLCLFVSTLSRSRDFSVKYCPSSPIWNTQLGSFPLPHFLFLSCHFLYGLGMTLPVHSQWAVNSGLNSSSQWSIEFKVWHRKSIYTQFLRKIKMTHNPIKVNLTYSLPAFFSMHMYFSILFFIRIEFSSTFCFPTCFFHLMNNFLCSYILYFVLNSG